MNQSWVGAGRTGFSCALVLKILASAEASWSYFCNLHNAWDLKLDRPFGSWDGGREGYGAGLRGSPYFHLTHIPNRLRVVVKIMGYIFCLVTSFPF